MKDAVISFPHLGDYHVPIEFFLKKMVHIKVVPSPPITKKTIELGTKYSPDFVCIPFKYNLGNYIETLENGATILLQAGGGCRYGYYAEVQEQILKDLGYHFKFYTLVDQKHNQVLQLYQTLKKLNPRLFFFKYVYFGLLTLQMIRYMDDLDVIIRKNIGFEEKHREHEKVKKQMLKEMSRVHTFFGLHRVKKKYKKRLESIKIKKPNSCMKVGIIGELYTSMEPFASYFLEKELASMNIEIKRFTNLTYLLLQKKHETKKLLKKVKKYCKYSLGADGMDNVARCLILKEDGYDGIIHIKPFGCTPEIGAMPIIDKVCRDENMPIIYCSFDSAKSEVGIKTRLEAFYDMLEMRKKR